MTITDGTNPQNQPLDWESDLAQLLNELSTVQEDLLAVLQKKRDRMAAGDTSGMQAMEPDEQQLCDRLQECHDQRSQLLSSAADQGLPSDNLGDLAMALPSEKRGDIQKQVKSASYQMQLLRHHSLTNWVIAQRTLLHVSQLLEIYATGGQPKPTYGEGKVSSSGGALVDHQA